MNKTAVITGAAKGIGKAIAEELAANNYNVVINYNKSWEQAIILQEEIIAKGYKASIFQADVSNFSQARELMFYSIRIYGSIDVLINNAGIAQQILFNDMTENDWDKMIKSNLNSVFNCSRNVIDFMLKKHRGNIINVSSMWGLVGASCEVHYSAAKAAIIGFTKALAKEVAPNGIRVNCVAPGVIQTDMLDGFSKDDLDILRNETPLSRLGNPKDIANIVAFLASDKSSFITGQTISSNGGFVI